jgi:transcription initiation factor TFIID subunit TAF12
VAVESMYNIRVPGFTGDIERSVRKPAVNAAHSQRLQQVKKAVAADMAEKEKEKNVRRRM